MSYNLSKSVDKKCDRLSNANIDVNMIKMSIATVIEIDIDDVLEPQMRHRDIRGSKSKYDPMAKYKKILRDRVLEQIDYDEDNDKPVEMEILYCMEPKGMTEIEWYEALLGNILPTKKPDIDNVMKLVQDTFNGTLYKDDAQIVGASYKKVYAEHPSTHIKFTILEDKNIPIEKGKRCNKQLRERYNKLLGR